MQNNSVKIMSPHAVKIENNPIPLRQGNEVLLKIVYGGICGSDLSSYRGSFAYFNYPRIPGHEFSAIIEDVDENNKLGLKKGMLVTANPYINCGKCYSCERGFVNCCESNETLGCQRDGVFSNYAVLPEERIVSANGINARELAVIEPFCISYHAVKRANLQKGERVLVIGAGTIGVLAALAAKMCGANVTICDVTAEKLKLAEKAGIEQSFINSSPSAFTEMVAQITHDKGFDVVLEAVGLPATFQNSIDAAAFAGRVVIIGVSKQNLDFNFTAIQKKELNVFGSRNALTSDFEEAIMLVKQGKLNVLNIITNVYSFDKAEEAFKDFDEKGSNMLKVLIKFSDEK